MEFLSQDGRIVHCIRSYSLRLVVVKYDYCDDIIKQRGKLTFKTLDQTLSIVGTDGHTVSDYSSCT